MLRDQAKQMFIREIGADINLRDDMSIWTSESFDDPANNIAMVLGIPAFTFAEGAI